MELLYYGDNDSANNALNAAAEQKFDTVKSDKEI
jgi:hypothetical protein